MSNLEIEKVLVVSTACVTRETAASIAIGAAWAPQWSRPEGWMFHVDTTLGRKPPAELNKALKLAKREGCAWLLLDADGPAVAELDEYEW